MQESTVDWTTYLKMSVHARTHTVRPEPIMLQNLPIMRFLEMSLFLPYYALFTSCYARNNIHNLTTAIIIIIIIIM